jgi:hypothetical protein
MEERLQNTASMQQSRVVNVDGTKRRFLQRTVQPIRSIKSGGSLASDEGNQQAQHKPPLHPQYSEEQRALHAVTYQKKFAIEQQVQQQLQQMQQLGLQQDNVRSSSRILAAASTPALYAALRDKASPALPLERAPSCSHPVTPSVSNSRPLSKSLHQPRAVSPASSRGRPQSCSTHSSVSRLSAGNLWRATDSAVSDKRSSAVNSEVDSQIGYLEETLAREKLRRMAAESELAYLKEIVASTRQQLSRPLL